MSSIGENIKRVRKEKNLTQKELAEKVGTTQQNLAQYENGKRNPKIGTVSRIASALKVNIDDLLAADLKSSPVYRVYERHSDLDNKLFLDFKNDFLTRDINWEPLDIEMINKFKVLNEVGQIKAIEQVEMLTKIPEYQRTESDQEDGNADEQPDK